jgi:hypothetical protein
MGVRALHVTEPSTCEVGGGCDIDDGERSAAIDPAFIETLEAFLAELPLAECRDEDMGHVAAGPDSMPSQVIVGTISTETLTDVHGLPRVRTLPSSQLPQFGPVSFRMCSVYSESFPERIDYFLDIVRSTDVE